MSSNKIACFVTIAIFLLPFICLANGSVDKNIECPKKSVEVIVRNENKDPNNFEDKLLNISDKLSDLRNQFETYKKDTNCTKVIKDLQANYTSYSGWVVTVIAVVLAAFSVVITAILALVGSWGAWYLNRITHRLNELGAIIAVTFYRKISIDYNNKAVDLFKQHDHELAVKWAEQSLAMLDKIEEVERLMTENKKIMFVKERLILKDIVSQFESPSEKQKEYRTLLYKSNIAFYYARLKLENKAGQALEWARKGKILGEETNDVDLFIDTYLYVVMNLEEYATEQDLIECKRLYRKYKARIKSSKKIPGRQKEKFSSFYGEGTYVHEDYQI